MATLTKAKNDNAANAVADVASKVTEEAKAVTETLFDVTNQAAKEVEGVFAAQQKLWKDSLNTWQQYNQAYFDFVLGAAQQSVEQSLAGRERLDKLVESNLKKVQALITAEQNLALETAETFQTQTQAASKRIAQLFTPPSLN